MAIGLIHDVATGPTSRNVQFDVDGWTVSYLWSYGRFDQVWIWDESGDSHPLTPKPVSVVTADEAHAIVKKALGDDAPAPSDA